jgi:hypothetical protein
MHRVISALGVVALVLAAGAAGAQDPVPCDFVTAGGYIINNNAKANFGVGGSCKAGGDGHGLWGHLEYVDHGGASSGGSSVAPFKVHWTTITGYFFCGDPACATFDPPQSQPSGTRLICGTATTNLPPPDDSVNWFVKAMANDQPGMNDTFMIVVTSQGSTFSYTTGDNPLAGGNIKIHKPNTSTGFFSGAPTSDNCPAFVPPTNSCNSDSDCTSPNTSGSCNLDTHTCCGPGTHFDPTSGQCVPD